MLNEKKNVPYGPNPRQRLDIYSPPQSQTVVMFWHGGSWRSGDKKQYRFMGRSLARLGYTVVLPNYRLYPEVLFPECINDAANAAKWVQDNLQPERIIFMGHSAGAQIAALLAYDRTYIRNAKVSESVIKGFIGVSGPYDFMPRSSLRPIFKNSRPENWKAISHISDNPLPSLLIHGTFDWVVSYDNSTKLHDQILKHNGTSTVISLPCEHMGVLIPFLPFIGRASRVRHKIRDFIESLPSYNT